MHSSVSHTLPTRRSAALQRTNLGAAYLDTAVFAVETSDRVRVDSHISEKHPFHEVVSPLLFLARQPSLVSRFFAREPNISSKLSPALIHQLFSECLMGNLEHFFLPFPHVETHENTNVPSTVSSTEVFD